MALPEPHPFRAVADKSYRPKMAPDEAQWERAFPLFVRILAADPRALTDHSRTLGCRRSALADTFTGSPAMIPRSWSRIGHSISR